MKKHLLGKKVIWVSLIILAMSVTEVFAGPRDHAGGFFLRLSAGYGYAQTELGDPAIMKYYGVPGDINFAIGAVVSDNFALHGSLFGWSIMNPTLEIGGGSGEIDGYLMLSGLGVGLTYYIMPANIYISPSVGLGNLTLDAGGSTSNTEMGLMIDLTLGKEWWVGGSWGLGVAGAVGYHSVQDSEEIEENWNGYSIGVRFSATLN